MTTTATDRHPFSLPGTGRARGLGTRARALATREVDAASVVMFRVLLGVLVAASAARFAARGWIFEHFVAPRVFFPYWGFEWVKPLSEQGMTALGVRLGRTRRAPSLLETS